MASQTEICNDAAIILGCGTINAITDQTNQAIAFNAVWNLERDNEFRAHVWRFSIMRAALPALATAPASGPYTQQFELPSDCLRVLQAGDSFPGIDLSDIRTAPTTDDYSVEGRMILSNLPAPLSLKYVRQITATGDWDASFCKCLAARIARTTCFRITESIGKQREALIAYKDALAEARQANALEGVPTVLADDTWITTRPIGAGGAPTTRFGV